MSTPRFTLIGENIHASRILRRDGRHVVTGAGGQVVLRYRSMDGTARELPVPEAVLQSKDGEKGRIKHVQAAVLAGMSGHGDAQEAGQLYLKTMALRQAAAGADFLDLNVDEVSADDGVRQEAMRWLVGLIEEVAPVPIGIDSSSPAVQRAGLSAARCRAGRPLINSVSLERADLLEAVADAHCPVILSAAGIGGLPGDATERVTNAMRMVEQASGRGIPLPLIFIDPLVLPSAVSPDATRDFLTAVGELRRKLGPEIHITGGLSNVSYGLPARRILNEAFLALAIEAGADSGILDPLAIRVGRPSIDPASPAWQLAINLLLGRDPFGRAFLKAHRAGELGS
jgi:5-methyltetrahydrofolate--homocysteine methyltransferase